MINRNKNNNFLIKDSIVETPKILAEDIYNTLKRKPFKNILDIGAFKGKLSNPFTKKTNTKIIGIDVIDDYKDSFDKFILKDYLELTKKDIEGLNIDLIISNPPFGKHLEHGELYPHLFIKKTIELFGENIPMVFIVPQWYLSNSKKRMDDLNKLNITKITYIHKNIFNLENENIIVEASAVYINIKTHKKHTFLSFDKNKVKVKKKRIYKSITLTEEQDLFLKNNVNNFNKYIKELISKDFKDFPKVKNKTV
jgi:predicted RNA methylase